MWGSTNILCKWPDVNILGLAVLEAKLRVLGEHLCNRTEDKFHEFFINEIQNIIIEFFLPYSSADKKNEISNFFFFFDMGSICLIGVNVSYHEIDHKGLSVKTIVSSQVIKK